jgi:15-cis-phytoene synthase
MDNTELFKKSSTTYFYSSFFFPKHILAKVTTLYAFVRTADNFVDATPQDTAGFIAFRKYTEELVASRKPSVTHENITTEHKKIVQDFMQLAQEVGIQPAWISAFLDAMEADLYKKKYDTYKELQVYMYGSAEVVGLMMCKIMNIPEKAYPYAQKLGEAMQLINFIRDINEDITLGRQYIPQEDATKFELDRLNHEFTHITYPHTYEYLLLKQYSQLLRFEIDRYLGIQNEAEKGYKYIPRSLRIAIKTAADMYKWTASEIYKNPSVVFTKKVKPSKWRVITTALYNTVFI